MVIPLTSPSIDNLIPGLEISASSASYRGEELGGTYNLGNAVNTPRTICKFWEKINNHTNISNESHRPVQTYQAMAKQLLN